MKILDTANAGARLKAFILWGTLLLVVQYIASMIFGGTSNGLLVIAITILFSLFAGYMVANALKGKTGDKRSSAIYGAIVPLYATILGWLIAILTGSELNLSLPLLPMLAGLIGGLISQKRF